VKKNTSFSVSKENFGENKGKQTEEVREMGGVVEVAGLPPFWKLSILSLRNGIL